MHILEAAILGLVRGLTSVLPVGSVPHCTFVQWVMGVDAGSLMTVLLDLAVLLGLMTGCRKYFSRMRRQRTIRGSGSNLLRRQLSNAVVTLVIGYFVMAFLCRDLKMSLPVSALLLLGNGTVLYLAGRMPRGNKDARNLTPADSISIGLGGALAGFGLSGSAGAFSASRARGAGKAFSLPFVFSLLVAVQGCRIFTDLLPLFMGGGTGSADLWSCLAAAAACFLATRAAISVLEQFCVRSDPSDFSYYCWGAGLLTFILYLFV